MPVEQIRRIDALAAHFGIEVIATRRESAAEQNVVDRQGYLANVVGELVRVPSVLRIAAIHVYRAQDAQRDRGGDLVFEAMPGQRGMVRFDVELHFLLEAVGEQ